MSALDGLLLLTSEQVPGRAVVAALGLVRGSAVRARHVGSDIVASLRHLVGGEVREYSDMLEAAREAALARMAENARALGADAVVSVRLETSTIRHNAAEVVAYGTAVRLAAS